jgi:hypothetical protein
MKILLILFIGIAANAQSLFTGVLSTNGAATPQVATPTDSPGAGSYSSTQSVTLTTSTSGATICYTTDGSSPVATTPGTCDGSPTQTYSGAISVAATTTIKAIGTKSALTNSSVLSSTYTINTSTVTTTSCAGGDNGGGSGTTATTSTVALGSGHAVVCFVHIEWPCSGMTATIADLSSGANTFTEIGSGQTDPSVAMCSRMFYAKNTTAVGSNTYTVTWSGSATFPAIACQEVSGASTTSPINAAPATATATGTSVTSPASGSFTINTGEQAIFGGTAFPFGRTITADTGYTLQCQSPNKTVSIQTKGTAGSTQTNTFSMSGAASSVTNMGVTVH